MTEARQKREGAEKRRCDPFCLLRHFESRGGTFIEREFYLDGWRELRWPTDGTPLHATYNANGGDSERAFAALPPQPTLGDVLGSSRLVFTDVAREVQRTTPLLQANLLEFRQARGFGFSDAMAAGVDLLDPTEWLCLLSQQVRPKEPGSYLNSREETVEWIGGIAGEYAAGSTSDSSGAYLYIDGAAFQIYHHPGFGAHVTRRGRSAFRC